MKLFLTFGVFSAGVVSGVVVCWLFLPREKVLFQDVTATGVTVQVIARHKWTLVNPVEIEAVFHLSKNSIYRNVLTTLDMSSDVRGIRMGVAIDESGMLVIKDMSGRRSIEACFLVAPDSVKVMSCD
ncbi:MAG: hypothetical protein KF777_09220 [Planctomycetaceae bacterium]|nr:hypothetical protein [Planctomycetaceae bacterium]